MQVFLQTFAISLSENKNPQLVVVMFNPFTLCYTGLTLHF